MCIYLETHESVNKPKVLIGSHPASPQQYPVVNVKRSTPAFPLTDRGTELIIIY